MTPFMTLGCLVTIVGVALLIVAYTAASAVPVTVGVIITAVGLTVAVVAAVTKA